MKTIVIIHEDEFGKVNSKASNNKYDKRVAARAILFDLNNRVYLMRIEKQKFHKLPGGGVESHESIIGALKRELMEEVGCEIEVIAEVGSIIEYRNYSNLKQTSYCYIARQIGDKKDASLDDYELESGTIDISVGDIDDAIKLLESDTPTTLGGKFMKKRDLTFLHEAKKIASGTLY